jgi:L-ascorbate 6-phosphate lactonase
VSRTPFHLSIPVYASSKPYVFTRATPYDRSAPIEYVVPRLLHSRTYTRIIREFEVPTDDHAIWHLGQNGFLLQDAQGLLIGIDLYLSNSCATTFTRLPYRLDRQLPIFIEPEDPDIDVFITTHSHDDHADPETIRRMKKDGATNFLGAVPTDTTDLNHTGMLLPFGNGIRFYDTDDTAYTERLPTLLPEQVDICAICINGRFHNLAPAEAAAIVKAIRPRVVIPCHYDLRVNNMGSPEAFREALDEAGADAIFVLMKYYEPWLYRRHETGLSLGPT